MATWNTTTPMSTGKDHIVFLKKRNENKNKKDECGRVGRVDEGDHADMTGRCDVGFTRSRGDAFPLRVRNACSN